jgi:hypothetical protein
MVAAGGLKVAAAGAPLVGPDGATLVGPDGASLIGPDGATLIGNNGNTIVAAGGGNVVAVTGSELEAHGGLGIVAAGGGNIVAAGGLNLVGPDGASLVGPDGGSLVGPDGASVVGNGAAGYALAQAAAAGAQLPVAGMLVSAVSLDRRTYLPIGETPDGKPVYAAYTDAAGGFSLTVPPGDAENVMVVASLPGRREAGGILNAITPPDAGEVAVDEDAALATRYLRRCLVGRLADLIAAPTLDRANSLIELDTSLGGDDSAARAVLRGIVQAFQAIGARRGITTLADRALARHQARVLAQAIVDGSYARLDVASYEIDPLIVPKWRNPESRLAPFPVEGAKALDVLRAVFLELRLRATAKMAAPDGTYTPLPPTFFQRVAIGTDPSDWLSPKAGQPPWFERVIEAYGAPTYPVTKPTEVGDFLVDHYLGVNRAYVSEPVWATFRLLDPKAYPAEPSRFPTDVTRPAALEVLARLNAKFPEAGFAPTDPQFGVAGRAAALPYGDAITSVGFTLFIRLGLALTSGDGLAEAIAKDVVLPTAVPAE